MKLKGWALLSLCKPLVFVIFALLMFGVFLSTFYFIPSLKNAKAAGNTYYISTSGSDANNGTSTSTPWAHHPWDANATGTAQSKVPQPGDIFVMKKGDIWYDTYLYADNSGTSIDHITTTSVDSWGSGAAILSGAYNPSLLTWAVDGTSYKATVAANPNVVIYGSTRLTKNAGATNTVALNQYDWSSANGGTLWVNVGESPTNDVINIAKRNNVILTANYAGNYLTFSNLTLESANTTNSGVAYNQGNTDIVFNNDTVRYFVYAGLYLYNSSGNNVTNCIISNPAGVIPPLQGIYANLTPGIVISGNNISGSMNGGIGINNSNNAQVDGNNISGTTNYAVLINLSNNATLENNNIHNNNGPNGSVGIISSNTAVVTGNIINSSSGYGINIAGSNSNNIYGNSIYNNGNTYSYPTALNIGGIWINGASSGNIIRQNNVYNNYIGIKVQSGGNEVSNNIIRDTIVNGIDVPATGATSLIINNTVIHNPAVSNTPSYTGHGIDIQATGQRVTFGNNLITIKQNGGNSQGLCISDTTGITTGTANVIQVLTDYNFYYDLTSDHNAYIGKLNGAIGAQYNALGLWQAAVQGDSKIFNLSGTNGLAEANSRVGNPLLTNMSGNDFTLQSLSPLIDTGAVTPNMTSVTTDYLDKPIYGVPDVGAYEYQPPHNLAAVTPDTIDIGAGARVYADGKFRDLGTTNSVPAKLKVTPSGGSFTAYDAVTTRPTWLDITNITNWTNTHKTWTESNSQNSGMVTDHTIGDLEANKYYNVKVDNILGANMTGNYCTAGLCLADNNGIITFTYTGGYSTHTFDVESEPATVASSGSSNSSTPTTPSTPVAKFPETGIPPSHNNITRNIFTLSGVLVLVLTSLIVVLRKRRKIL